MNILFATSDANGYVSGVHSWTQNLALELKKLGNQCCFLVFTIGNGPYPFIDFLIKNNFQYAEIPFNKYRDTLSRTKWLVNRAVEFKTDVFFPGFFVAGFYATPWLKKRGITTLLIIHSDDVFWKAVSERFVFNKDTKWNADIVFAVSKYLYDSLGGNTLKNFYYSPNGILQSTVKATYNKNPFRVVYIGRIEEEQKRILDTVKGMVEVLKKLPEVEFDIYGSGNCVDAVKQIIDNDAKGIKIFYKGVVPNENIFEIISKYQSFILLSDYEGLPISLLEAMSCGLVPICTNIKSGVNQVVIAGETGFLVNNRDSDVFDCIEQMLQNPTLWEKYSNNASEFVGKNFNIKTQANRFIEKIAILRQNPEKKINYSRIKLPLPHPNLHCGSEDIRKQSVLKRGIKKIHKIIYR